MNDQTHVAQPGPELIEPVLPVAKMNLVPPKSPVIGRVVSNDRCMKGKSASFVRHTVIDVAGTPLEGVCLAGQSFGVIAPGVDETGKPHKVRLYSIANGSAGEDGKANLISTTPKRTIDEYWPQKPDDDATRHDLFLGVCSNHLCDLRPGDEVKLTGPNGKRFLLPVDPAQHNYVFLATGTGIAPFRGFVLDLFAPESSAGGTEHASSFPNDVHLIMGSPYTTDLLYDDLFTELAEMHGNFHYHTAISRERRPDGSRGLYVHQLVEEQMDTTFRALLEDPRTLIYMCGLIGMQFGVYQVLAKAGLDRGYQTMQPDIAEKPIEQWQQADMKRHIRPTARMMVEVY